MVLPKTISQAILLKIINAAYSRLNISTTDYERKTALRDIAVFELFTTGLRKIKYFTQSVVYAAKGSVRSGVSIGDFPVVSK